jgi:hypothetical protein
MNPVSAASDGEVRIETWKEPIGVDDVDALAAVLHACVHAGASVSFVLPFSHQDAKAFWSGQVLPEVAAGSRRLLIARLGGSIVGPNIVGPISSGQFSSILRLRRTSRIGPRSRNFLSTPTRGAGESRGLSWSRLKLRRFEGGAHCSRSTR